MSSPTLVNNYVGGEYVPPIKGAYMDVLNPATDEVIAKVAVSTAEDVDAAVARAKQAYASWSELTHKARAAIMFRFHHLMETHADELAEIVVRENGKNKAEALASVAKANETVEWACSLPQLAQGKILQVSRGITCFDHRDPLGVIVSIVPMNFPVMVPMWTIPIALAAGNVVILKPSEKVPMTMSRVAQLLAQAGVPPGVFQVINGTTDSVTSLIDHPDVAAVTFVGSSKVAEIVAKRARALNKRCLSLGGAKNHLVALPDCDSEGAATDIVASFAGCCGQRCMAASVLVLVGDTGDLLDKVVSKSAALKPGTAAGQVGPVIDRASQSRIMGFVDEAASQGAKLLLDGRSWAKTTPGSWFGPTVILHNSTKDRALHEEIFGPILSIVQVSSWEEAIAIENANPFGNAACIYTTVGAHAQWFQYRFRAAMIGVNIGIPVPREPFSFGGMSGTLSKFGDSDITGDGLLEFVTTRRKITTKWAFPTSNATAGSHAAAGLMSSNSAQQGDVADRANFNGHM